MNNQIESHKIYTFIFVLYLSLGPIYWTPLLSHTVISAVKFILFIFAALYPFTLKSERSKFIFPGGHFLIITLISFALITISISATESISSSTKRLQTIGQAILIIYTTGFAIRKNLINLIISSSTKIFSILVLSSFVLMIVIPDQPNTLNDQLTISETGFGGSRTGWGPNIALYIPWIYSINYFSFSSKIMFGFAMIANILLIAGRTGMLTALIPYLLWVFKKRGLKSRLFNGIALASVAIYAISNQEALRLSDIDTSNRAQLEELSTGRTEQYITAINAISDSPIIGYGINAYKIIGTEMPVHNFFLNFTTEGGIFYAISALLIVFIPLYKNRNFFLGENSIKLPAFLTVLSGFITSLFEPFGVFLGNFHGNSFWWICIAICISSRNRIDGTDIKKVTRH